MKSILALLVVVALCNADIVKDGGLKGSWDDTFNIVSDFDIVAPGIDYDGDVDFWYNYIDNPLNMSGNYLTTYYNSISFSITNEDEDMFYYSDYSGVEASIVDGDYSVDGSCSVYYDLSVDCSFSIVTHSGQHVFTPVITVTDGAGNWATYSTTVGDMQLSAVFTDVDRPYTWSVVDHTPDFTAPTILTATLNGAAADVTVTLGASNVYSNTESVDVAVTVQDHQDSDADDYDEFASGIWGVWAVLVDADDATATEWTEALYYDSYVASTMVYTYGATWSWSNWAPTGTWTILRFTAVDYAGNWATEKAFDVSVMVTFDNADDVTSCQTLLIDELSSDYDATGSMTSYAQIYWTAGCVPKYTAGTNYGYVSWQSPKYLMVGDTLKSTRVIGNYYSGYGYDATYMYTNVLSATDVSAVMPGTSFSGDGFSDSVQIENGQAGDSATVVFGSWTLYELITFTASGAVQRYTFDLGAASSVVPSAVAVAVAAVVAMLRL